MFTGIINAMGLVSRVEPLGPSVDHGIKLIIQSPQGFLEGVVLGESIAINGACMTVTQFDGAQFVVEVSAESLKKTAPFKEKVHLERAMRAHDRINGHWVSGHVDAVASIVSIQKKGESHELRIAAPLAMAPYFAYKGSVAVHGVSLTINEVIDAPEHCELVINLIAHTFFNTLFSDMVAKDQINIEVDLISRYVHRIFSMQRA